MKLSLKKKAALITTGMVVAFTVFSVIFTNLIMMIPVEAVPYIAIVVLLGLLFKIVYGIVLRGLEIEELAKD